MIGFDKKGAPLGYSVFVTTRPGLNRQLPPGYESLAYVPNSSTLVYGERDAVLIDTPLTVDATQSLIDWIVSSGKNLTTIYLTHGHGDHFFGIHMIKERFPHARAVARPAIVQHMVREMSAPFVDEFWIPRFPGQVPEIREAAEPLEGHTLELEGHRLIAIDTGYTDTALSTSLHVPSIGLVVAGDVAYNGPHPYMAEGNPESWPLTGSLRWIRSKR